MSRTVLTADDSPAFRAALGDIVDAADGFELVAETWSGEEAVRLSERLQPDLAMLDVRMAGMDGIETAAQIAEVSQGTIVILLTAGDLDPLTERARAAGVAAVVDKLQLHPGLLETVWSERGRADG